MAHRDFDPRRLDMRAFAHDGSCLSGRWPLAGFERLQDLLTGAEAEPAVTWRAEGREVSPPGGARQTWLHLQATATLALRCQRCLDTVLQPLQVDRRFLFARDEDEAARLDEEGDDDVLVLTRELDLHRLVEDELLLELPLVPRHDHCDAPAPLIEEPAVHRPFGALSGLQRGRG